MSRDKTGNAQAQAFGSIVVDRSLTPDLVQLPSGQETAADRAWMDSGCTLLGRDRRSARMSGLSNKPAQQLYASWDQKALRLAWTGANWGAGGDLYIYLDTGAGGTNETFSPHPVPETASTVLLPASL